MRKAPLACGILLLVMLFSLIAPALIVRAQEDLPSQRARTLLAQLTPEERVGQLFLVTFTGSSVSETSPIYDLIVNSHIGGVVLLRENDNFTAAPNTISDAYQLISRMQNAEWTGSEMQSASVLGEPAVDTYIPLLVGISQEGDGYPNDQILSGLTVLPNQMAIGATWQPSLAEQVGQVAGSELSKLGFNLFIGPSLDVLESPNDAGGAGLGTRTFGGDPFWVGRMGQAYISGLHAGSSGRMVVVSKHFPGRGSSDRSSGEEVATVRKSLEQLKQIELAPFFAVTGSAPDLASTTDGLLVSHIRYQGFQGNIRATTRPVSFDPQALSQILSLPAFDTWRKNGGLMVSDDLGSLAVRRFYDPSGNGFSARLVARDAFLAGNDLLYLGNIVASDSPDNYTTVLHILEFFIQKYNDDPAFAQRVDDAVLRILTVKFGLYINFLPTLVTPSIDGLQEIGTSDSVTFEVARQSATLISPDLIDLDSILSSPPAIRDWMVFITDSRPALQCSTCADVPMPDSSALQQAVLRLYGPDASALVSSNRLSSYSFNDLAMLLQGGSGPQTLENAIIQADWIVISMLDIDPLQSPLSLVHRFLTERLDLLGEKHIILFAFNAPYFLDATDISKITAYYGLYSKSAHFQDIAAPLLFQEVSPIGSLPVSVPGIGYDLLSATSPDPDQVIGLSIDMPVVPTPSGTTTPEPALAPSFRVGDAVSVRTSLIVDHNQRPVPDGTGVRFTLSTSGDGGIIQQVDAVTVTGVAQASFGIERSGLLEIRAASDPATTSVVIQLDASAEGIAVTVLPPTPTLDLTTPDEVLPTPDEQELTAIQQGFPGFSGWLVMAILLAGLGYLVFWLAARLIAPLWGVRLALTAILGGLVSYNYLALGLSGGVDWIKSQGLLGIMEVVLLGVVAGVLVGLAWFRLALTKQGSKKTD